jgi:hypothetical protein
LWHNYDMEQRNFRVAKPIKDKFERVVETYRNTLTDDEMGVFLTLHEHNGAIEQAALELEMSVEVIEEIVERFLPKKQERRTKKGEAYRRRLSQEAFKLILENHEDLNERERQIIESLIGAQNQVVAATSLDMKHSAFIKEYVAMRKKHGF